METESRKIELRSPNRWVLSLPNIDACLVKQVNGLSASAQWIEPQVTISLYNAIGSSLNSQLLEWMSSTEPRSGTLALLGPTGNLDEIWRFTARPVRFELDELNYDKTGTFMTRLVVALTQLTIENSGARQ